MTEVVTNTAAYVQPLLFTPKGQQAIGAPAPDSPQSELAIALAASQQQQALEATQVAATPDQPSLKNNSDGPSNRSFQSQLPTSQPRTPEPAAAPTGPAKARVEVSVVDISAALSATARAQEANPAAAPAPQPVAKPVTLSDLGGGPAGPGAAAPVEAPVPTPGVLGPAAVVKETDIAAISQNIFGAAFAPTQVVQPSTDTSPAQTNKNFIFAHRKLFAEQAAEVVQAQTTTGKFAAEDAKAAAFGTEVATGKFAAQPVAVAAATVGAQFAASAETAQKLFDKVHVESTPSVEATTGEVRLYDKVAQADTQSQRGNPGDQNPGDQTLDSRQSLYQRAQAVAAALGDKSGNPAVKKLVATLESYALIAGVGGRSTGRKLRVTV
jgi:hypothetical protein